MFVQVFLQLESSFLLVSKFLSYRRELILPSTLPCTYRLLCTIAGKDGLLGIKDLLDGERSRCSASGLIDGLAITGLEENQGRLLLSRFIEVTRDVQVVAVLASIYPDILAAPSDESILRRACEAYRSLLGRWGMSAALTVLDQRLSKASLVPPCALHCGVCGAVLVGAGPRAQSDNVLDMLVTYCPNVRCKRPVPPCCVCLLPLSVVNSKAGGSTLPVGQWPVWCASCGHGGHLQHIDQWFSKYDTCPVKGCGCRCADDGGG